MWLQKSFRYSSTRGQLNCRSSNCLSRNLTSKSFSTRSCNQLQVNLSSKNNLSFQKNDNFRFHSFQKRWYSVVSFDLADIGEGITEVEVLQWFVREGDTVQQFDKLCEVQSDKATVEITSRYSGKITKLHHAIGEMANVGKPLCDIDVEDEEKVPENQKIEKQPEVQKKAETYSTHDQKKADTYSTHDIVTSRGVDKILAAPAVRYLARQKKIDLHAIKGSGKHGRVTKEDLLSYLEKGAAPEKEAVAIPIPVSRPSTTAERGADTVIPLRGYARAMAQTMTQSLSIPHLGFCDEVNLDKLIQLRSSIKSVAKERGTKLSYLPFMIKALSLAMKRYPLINSRINNELTEVTLISSHNIGIAVATPTGLVVPNIKNVQNLSLMEVAEELNHLINLAQQNKLTTSNLQGGTVSLSNIGSIGGTYAHPIVVVGQACIGAVGKIQKLPRFTETNEVVPVHVMNVSWSADHRIVDGATIANFSNLWKQYLEEPSTMILDTK